MSLLALPQEILDNIAFFYACPTVQGIPTPLTPLLVTCSNLYHRLKLPECSRPADDRDSTLKDGNSFLYARIYRFKFSTDALIRREFTPTASECNDLFVRYIGVLRGIKAAFRSMDSDLVDPNDTQDMLSAMFIMLLEDDGLNSTQLDYMRAYDCVLGLLMGRGRHQGFLDEGWPEDNIINTCGLWVLWLLTTTERIQDESEQFVSTFVDRLFPFVSAPFKYSTGYAPANHFHLPLSTNQFTSSRYSRDTPLHAHSIPTHHGPYPVYRLAHMSLGEVQAGRRIDVTYPPISIAAKLLVTARRQIHSPLDIPAGLPRTREEARQQGRSHGLTQEDIQEWNSGGIVFPGDIPRNSMDWDCDWWRMRMCGNAWEASSCHRSVFQSGSVQGLWSGRRLIPDEILYHTRLAARPTKENAPTEMNLGVAVSPLSMRLEEHVSFLASDDKNVLPCGGSRPMTRSHSVTKDGLSEEEQARVYRAEFDQGLRDGWFPSLTSIKSTWDGAGIEITHPTSAGKCVYTTLGKEVGTQGRWHDTDVCPGCRWREALLEKARRGWESVGSGPSEDLDVDFDPEAFDGSDSDNYDSEEESLSPSEEETPCDPRKVPPCNGVRDTILTGETDSCHSNAWSDHSTFRGRVRPWDGSLCILRIPRDPGKGPIIIYGNIIGSRNFVGNWRTKIHDVYSPAYEGAVVMGKRE